MPAAPASPNQTLPLRDKLAYTSGVFLDQAGLHAVNNLAMPVYNVVLGMNPAYIGYALAIFRIWDAMIDPLMGFITDRFDSRWGRRKPFMLVGAILCGIIFPLVWFASPAWSTGVTMTYFIGLNVLYFTALTIYAIPYQALGYELTPDFDQRTSLYTYRGWVAIIGFMGIPWIFALAQYDGFGSTIAGVRTVTVGVGVFFALTALVPVWLLRERNPGARPVAGGTRPTPPKIGMFRTIKESLQNGAYRRIVLVSCVAVIASNVVAALTFYVNVYHVFGGNVKQGSIMVGAVGTTCTVVTLVGITLLPRLSRRFGKANMVIGCLVVQLAGSALKWVCFTPAFPWLQLLPAVLLTLGNYGFWTMMPAMVADTCDYDEFLSGRRREGIFASVTQWVNKVGYSAANAVSGLVLVWIGFDVALGGGQSPATIFWMRVLFAAVPAAFFIVALLVFWGYPLTSTRLQEIRNELDRRRGAS